MASDREDLYAALRKFAQSIERRVVLLLADDYLTPEDAIASQVIVDAAADDVMDCIESLCARIAVAQR